MFIVPETPRYLLVKKRNKEAIASFKWLNRMQSDEEAREKMLNVRKSHFVLYCTNYLLIIARLQCAYSDDFYLNTDLP